MISVIKNKIFPKIILIVLFLFIIVLGLYTGLANKCRQIYKTDHEYVSLENQYQKNLKLLAHFNTAGQSYKSAQLTLQQFTQFWPDSDNINYFLNNALEKIYLQTGLFKNYIRFYPPLKNNNFTNLVQIPVEITFSGTYQQYINFIKQLDLYYNFISIDQFTLKRGRVSDVKPSAQNHFPENAALQNLNPQNLNIQTNLTLLTLQRPDKRQQHNGN